MLLTRGLLALSAVLALVFLFGAVGEGTSAIHQILGAVFWLIFVVSLGLVGVIEAIRAASKPD